MLVMIGKNNVMKMILISFFFFNRLLVIASFFIATIEAVLKRIIAVLKILGK